MKLKSTLVAITVMMAMLFLSPAQTSAQGALLEIEVTDYPSLVFNGDRVPVEVSLSNVGSSAANDVVLRSSSGESRKIGSIIAGGGDQETLFLDNYVMGINEVEIYATFSSGQAAHWSIRFEVRPPEESVTMRVIEAPPSIHDGMVYAVQLEVQNLWQEAVSGTRIRSGEDVLYDIGVLNANQSLEIELRVEDYEIGINRLQLVAEHERGSAPPISVEFEVRPSHESIALRIVDAPPSLYEGMVYTAQVEVQNLWAESISATRITNGEDVLYYVGVLEANESQQLVLRVEDYEMGSNRLQLVTEHSRGSALPVDLEFEVIPAESAVKAYLGSLSTATYLTENIELSIVIAASEDAEISDLELRALSEGVQPEGYYLGEQVAAEEEVEIPDVGSLLTGTQETEEEELERAVMGRELSFEVKDISVGNQPLNFQINYRLGSAVVQRSFSVDATVLQAPGVRLIQADRIVATKGEEAVIRLHVANSLPVKVDAVRVIPVGNFEASPSEFFIGGMSPDDFLPASFSVPTDDLQDGDELTFKLIYRVGRETYETPPIQAVVNLEGAQGANPAIYIVPPVVVVLLVLLWWYSRRRRWIR